MKEMRYTLLSEGSSDRALLPILNWLLGKHLSDYAIQPEWADLGRLPKAPKTLSERIQRSIELYPCQLLFVHRDADSQGREQRVNEISRASQLVEEILGSTVIIGVIPVRMMEAWLLFSEDAIRIAAENPQGKEKLNLPSIKDVEKHSDPKTLLQNLLRQASGASGRRLKKFNARLSAKVQRVAEVTQDFSHLSHLEAFQSLEADLVEFIEQNLSKLDQ